MKQINRFPSYLIRNPHSYCFRINVPKDIQLYVGKKELRRSLRTGYMSVAKQKARALAAEVQMLFQGIREMVMKGDLTDHEIKQIVNEHIHKLFNAMEYLRIGRLDLETKHELFPKLNRYVDEMGTALGGERRTNQG